tara:strand:- start:3135 stop:3491 length:357 start_codon:yes stop_codon:yes gene_type:complete
VILPDNGKIGGCFEPKLRAEIDELRARSGATTSDRAPVALDQQSVGRLSRMDTMRAQAMAQATERRRHQRIQQVEAALNRIGAGEYGFCLSCGDAIETRRLEADPAAPLCLSCSRGER